MFGNIFTALLKNAVIVMVFGGQELMFFLDFVGNHSLELIMFGLLSAYIGNVFLREKIQFPIINKYLG